MSYFYSQSITQIKNDNGKKQTSFYAVKGNNTHMNEIKGISNDGNTYEIQKISQKKNEKTGIFVPINKKIFKIKASELKNIMNNSTQKKKSMKNKAEPKNIKEKSMKSKPVSKSVKEKRIKNKPIVKSVKKKSDKKIIKK